MRQVTVNSNWQTSDCDVVMTTVTGVHQFIDTPLRQSEINERFIAFLERTDIPFASDVTNISIQGQICGIIPTFLLDTGASVSDIHSKIQQQLPSLASTAPLPLTIPSIKSVSGDTIPVLGQVHVPFEIGNNRFPFKALVLGKMAYDVILGRDFLEQYQANIDFQNRILSLGTAQFSSSDNCPQVPVLTSDPTICFIHANTSFLIPPQTEIIGPGVIAHTSLAGGIGIVEPRTEFVDRYHVGGATELVKVWEDNSVPIRLLNPTNQPVRIYHKTCIGQMTMVDHDIAAFDLHQSDLEAEAGREIPTAVDCDRPSPLDISTEGLTEQQQTRLKSLLDAYQDIFAYTPDQLGRTSIVKHAIDMGEHPPIRLRSYRTNPANKEEIDKQINEMLKNDVIAPSTSPWASPVVLVKKSDGSMRFCIDYRKLNQITTKDSHPLPKITEALDALGGARYFPLSTFPPDTGRLKWMPTLKKKQLSSPTTVYFNSMCFHLGSLIAQEPFKGL